MLRRGIAGGEGNGGAGGCLQADGFCPEVSGWCVVYFAALEDMRLNGMLSEEGLELFWIQVK